MTKLLIGFRDPINAPKNLDNYGLRSYVLCGLRIIYSRVVTVNFIFRKKIM